MIYDYIIIGSGLATVSFLKSFQYQKYKILIIDSGKENFSKTSNNDSNHFKKNFSPKFDNLKFQNSNKLFKQLYNIQENKFSATSTLSVGGSGSIWGANVAEFSFKDFQLPYKYYEQLKDGYRKISEIFGISGESSDLNKNIKFMEPLKIKNQINEIINQKNKLKNFTIRKSSLAVVSSNFSKRKSYDYTNKAAPYENHESILNSKFEMNKILKEGKIEYMKEIFAEKFQYDDYFYNIYCKNLKTKKSLVLKTKKIILGAGAIGSSILVSKSLQKDRVYRLNHNPAYFFTFLNLNLFPKFNEQYVNMANAEFIIHKNKFNEIYGNIYPGSVLMDDAISKRFKSILFKSKILNQYFKENINIGNAYLDSSFSNTEIIYKDNKVKIKTIEEKENTNLVRKIIQNYFKTYIPFTFKKVRNGYDSHYASTIPFSNSSDSFTVSYEGYLNNTEKKIIVIDSSPFKYLPSKPLSLTIMANAYRIGNIINEC